MLVMPPMRGHPEERPALKGGSGADRQEVLDELGAIPGERGRLRRGGRAEGQRGRVEDEPLN